MLARGQTLLFLIVILFTTGHFLGLGAILAVEDQAEVALSEGRRKGIQDAKEVSSAVSREPELFVMLETKGTDEAVSDLFRALSLAADNRVGMSAITHQAIEDLGSQAGVDCPLAILAVEVLIFLRQLEAAVLTRAAILRPRGLQKFATFAHFAELSTIQDHPACDAVEDHAVIANVGFNEGAGGPRAIMILIALLGIDGKVVLRGR